MSLLLLKLAPTNADASHWFCARLKNPDPEPLLDWLLVLVCPVVVCPVVVCPVVVSPVVVPVVPPVVCPVDVPCWVVVVVVVVPVWSLVDVCADNAVGTLTANAATTAS
jgi:hypothetical protein